MVKGRKKDITKNATGKGFNEAPQEVLMSTLMEPPMIRVMEPRVSG